MIKDGGSGTVDSSYELSFVEGGISTNAYGSESRAWQLLHGPPFQAKVVPSAPANGWYPTTQTVFAPVVEDASCPENE